MTLRYTASSSVVLTRNEYEIQDRRHITATTEANVIFHNGLNLETGGNGWFTKLTERLPRWQRSIWQVTKLVQPMYLIWLPVRNKKPIHTHGWIYNGIGNAQNRLLRSMKVIPRTRNFWKALTAYQKSCCSCKRGSSNASSRMYQKISVCCDVWSVLSGN